MPNQQHNLDLAFHALGDPTRRAVVQRLCRGPATVSELAEPFGMALPSFLQHMRVLEKSGLVRSAKKGRVRTCSLEKRQFRKVETWLTRQRALWEKRLDQMDEYVLSLKAKGAGDDGE